MKSNNIFTEPGEELKLLALELSKVKNILHELSQQMLQIERRVRVALSSYQKPLLPLGHSTFRCLSTWFDLSTPFDRLRDRSQGAASSGHWKLRDEGR